MPDSDLCFLSARRLRRLIDDRRVSVREVVAAHVAQVERYNGAINAVVTFLPDAALTQADAADAALRARAPVGPLHGLPVVHKDLLPTKGVRTTFGSPIFRDHVPDRDAIIVERLHRAGAISLGKSNTPEFGAGSQTFNEVFGTTRNPYDPSRTCGGSSGGAAVALAAGMVPIADGSDLGGSLRNPASFCNVVGLRPSPGRVPVWPSPAAWFPLDVVGPMARSVEDVALVLSAIAGPDPRAPMAIGEPPIPFAERLERRFEAVRIGWSRTLGGLPVDPRVTAVLDATRDVFSALGCEIVDVEPDFSGADEAFRTWRAWYYELAYGELLRTASDRIKATVVWNIEAGSRLSGPDLGRAERLRTELYHRMRRSFDRIDFLVAPTCQVPPFDADQEYVTQINGIAMETYLDWMRSCYYISVTGLPAISVPCGFTTEGLPVGLQLVGRHQDDLGVLQLAHAFERATETWKRRPALPAVERS